MNLTNQRRLAADTLNCSLKRVWFDQEGLAEVKEAITKTDVKNLINKGLIGMKQKTGVSRGRTRERLAQKRKGRQKGSGKREGKKTARLPSKDLWINKMRSQRAFLKELKEKDMITSSVYSQLYRKSKGNYFRSVRHLKLYLSENKLVNKK